MKYHQLTSEERYALSALRRQGLSQAAIGRALGRHPSTISRELHRNSRKDGGYRPFTAGEMTRGRRSSTLKACRQIAVWCLDGLAAELESVMLISF
jgi:transposase, IS30 family